MIMADKPELGGVLVALATPFTDDGSKIDESRLQAHIEHLLKAGVHGFVPGGSTGEFTALDMDERKQLLELVIKHTNGRVPIVAGIGALSTKDGLDLARHAAKAEAAALMVVPPFYDAPSYEELQEMLSEIHSASKLPIVYYNIPAATGMKLSPKQIAGLSKSGVKYLKDTSGDAPALTELMFGLSDQITTFNGWDTLTFYGLAAGSKGCVWGASNLIPELSVQLWEAVAVNGDLKKGRELWAKIWPICQFLESHNYPSAVKTGMELIGKKTGGMRKPFGLLKTEHHKEFATLLQDAGVKLA